MELLKLSHSFHTFLLREQIECVRWGMSVRIQQLNELTGLDEETIKEQILPYLATFPAKQALINHLQDLLGPGVKQNSFIQSYSDERFPPSSEATSTSNNNTLDSKSTASIPAKASGTRRAKTKFPSKLPPPRKVHASSFSREGAVYRKGQDDELLFGPSSSSKAGPSENLLSNAMPSISHFATPSASRPQTPNQANVPEESKATTGQNSSTAHISSPKAPREDEFVLVPTEEMKNIQQSIALLRGDSKDDPSIKAKPCFCQGKSTLKDITELEKLAKIDFYKRTETCTTSTDSIVYDLRSCSLLDIVAITIVATFSTMSILCYTTS